MVAQSSKLAYSILAADTLGKVITDFGGEDYGQSLALQSDGKIVVAGTSNGYFAVARYNDDGSLDKSFSGDGKLITTDIYNLHESDYGQCVAVQNDGKIIVAGEIIGDGESKSDFALVRYNTDGSLDKSFAETGMLTTDIYWYDFALSLSLQRDGKIVVSGSSNGDFALVRYNTDGSLDKSFSDDGKVTTNIGGTGWDFGNSVAIQSDGKIVVAGTSNGNFAVARYNTDGSLDKSFAGTGMLTTDTSKFYYGFHNSLTLQNDGKIVVAGTTCSVDGTNGDFVLVRYNTDGSLDKSFAGTGMLTTDILDNKDYDTAHSVTLQSDGKIVVSGGSNTDFALARYNTDGSLDKSFAGTGMLKTLINVNGFDGPGQSITVQNEGKILVAGYSNGDFALVRYNIDGSLDTSFSGNPDLMSPTVTTVSISSVPESSEQANLGNINIHLTFSEAIQLGIGKIQIHTGSLIGPVVASLDVATNYNLIGTYGNSLSITTKANLFNDTIYYFDIAGTAVKDLTGNSYDSSVFGVTTYIGSNDNDIFKFHVGVGNEIFDGSAGIDIVIFNGKEADYTIALSGSGFSIHDKVGTDGTDTIINIETLQFTDHTLTIAATPDAVLQESYRIYKAAFDRTPDYGGLGFWYKGMVGGISLNDVALGFTHSNEFVGMYGTNPTDANFLTLLYQHVLGRTYDQGGYDWWLNTLTTHVNTQANVLAQFSESAENIAHVAGVIANGIIYEVYAA